MTEQWTLSLDLLARASSALRTCVVDDVHLANRIGFSIEVLVKILRDSTRNFADIGTKNGYLALFIECAKKRRGNITVQQRQAHNLNGARGPQTQQQAGGFAAYEDAEGALSDLPQPGTIQEDEPFYHDSWLWPIGQDAYDILSYSMPELDTWEREH